MLARVLAFVLLVAGTLGMHERLKNACCMFGESAVSSFRSDGAGGTETRGVGGRVR